MLSSKSSAQLQVQCSAPSPMLGSKSNAQLQVQRSAPTRFLTKWINDPSIASSFYCGFVDVSRHFQFRPKLIQATQTIFFAAKTVTKSIFNWAYLTSILSSPWLNTSLLQYATLNDISRTSLYLAHEFENPIANTLSTNPQSTMWTLTKSSASVSSLCCGFPSRVKWFEILELPSIEKLLFCLWQIVTAKFGRDQHNWIDLLRVEFALLCKGL
jgi:hypothetical protein